MMMVRRVHLESNICARQLMRPILVVFMAGESLSLAGCGGAPSITLAGAYFPAWLLCAFLAVAIAVIVRTLMVVTGLSHHMPYQLAVCSSMGVIVALLVWQFWVAR